MNRREHRAIVGAYRDAAFGGATHRQAMSIMVQAAQQAISGGPQAVQSFMASQGFPQDGAWCGEFAAAIVHSTGGTPPAHPEVASNWRNFGTPTSTPHEGDVAIRRATGSYGGRSVSTGSTGSHVTFVGGVDPRTGTFTGLGGNQGANSGQPTLASRYPISGYDFRTPSTSQQSPSAASPLPTPIPGADRSQLASGVSSRMHIPQSSVDAAQQALASSGYGDTPHEDIPFAAPQMPDNIPAYEPQTYNPEQGYDIGGGFPASQGVPAYLNPEVQDQGFSVPMSYGYGSDFSAVPEGSYVPTADLNLASTYPVADLSQQQGDISASVGGDDIARFGGDLTLGGDVPSADYAYMGMPGDYGGDPAAQDFYAANDQYGEGGWYYDAQGNIVQSDPFGGSYADAHGAYDQQQQQAGSSSTSSGGMADAPHTGEVFASTQVDPNTGRISTFDPTTGGYTPVSGPGGWTTTGYGAGSAYGAGWAGSGGAGFGGYGGLGGSGAPQFWSSSGGVDTSTAGGLSHGGSDPSGSRPGGGYLHATAAQRESAGTMGDLKLQHFASKSGFGGDVDAYQAYQDQQSQQNDAAQQASLSGLGDPLDWKWHGTPGAGGFSQPKGTLHAGWDYDSGHVVTPTAGHWQPVWSPQQQSLLQSTYGKDWKYFNPGAPTGIASPKQPPQSSPPPEHLAAGGAIDVAQWMKRKSGKVPGTDHGVDEVYSLLRPGEIVVNRSQMRGLKVGNSKLLRADQKKAIKQAKKAA